MAIMDVLDLDPREDDSCYYCANECKKAHIAYCEDLKSVYWFT
jgi:hypothetical protein